MMKFLYSRLCLTAVLFLSSLAFAADDHGLDDQLSADAQMLAPAFISPTGPAPTPTQRSLVGQWGPVISWTPHIPVTAATLPDGRLLTFSSNQRTTFPVGAEFTYAAVWNPATGVFTEINNNRHDMFCGGTSMLPDGRVVVNGGRNTVRLSSIFNWRTSQWSALPNMNDGRWYNTSVAMTDGSVFTVTGDGGTNTAERWTSADGWKRLSSINWATVVSQPGYVTRWHPLMVVAPDGRLFHGGPTRQMNWVTTAGNGSLTYSGVNVPGTHFPKEGCFAMYDEGRILVAGGSLNTNSNPSDSSTGTSTNLAFTIDIRSGTPVVKSAASMKYVRQFVNSVILPNGEVMVIGGNTSGLKFNDTGSILSPEIWNPTTGLWREVTDMSVPRNYHSLALLLPDGRVWSGGGGLSGNSADHRDAQIYTPPMLFAADGSAAVRPVIQQAPSYIGPGTVFTVQATPGLTKFSFIKMSSQTHSMNTDLRYLSLPFTETSPGIYSVTAHANINVMTPGYWMLFGIGSSGAYSESKIIQVDPATTVSIASPGDQFSAKNAATVLAIYGVAPGNGTLTFSASSLPPGMVIQGTTGIISGTPTITGAYTPRVTVTDGITSASTTFNWTITPANVTHDFASFTGSNSSLQLNGSASVNGSILQLTPNGANLAGTAFLKTPLPLSNGTSFSTRFVFRMNGSGDGADGMTFMIQNDRADALGSPGGGLGYEGIMESLAIELDTYAGGTDPNANHIGVVANGIVSPHLGTYTAPFDLENGASHTLWAEYDGATNTLRIYLAQGVVTTRPATPVLTVPNIDLPASVGPNAWIGFSGATGGSTNTHEVLSWSFFSNAFALPTAPVLTSPGSQTGVMGIAVNLPINATDINQDTLTFSATGLPAGLAINSSTGAITGIPTAAAIYTTTVTVTDGYTTPVSATFTWTISNTLTLQPLVTTPVLAGVSVNFVPRSSGGANPRYRWDFGDGTPVTAYSSSTLVLHPYTTPGRFLVTLTATDDTGAVTSTSAYQVIHPQLTAKKPTNSTSIAFEDRATGNDRVWVVNPDSDSVTILDAMTRAKLAETSVGSAPRSVAIAPDGRAWVTNVESATLSILNSSTYAVAATVALPRGSRPFGLAFDPNGSAAYVVLEGSGQLLKLNAATGATLSTQTVGQHARHVSVSADGTRLYISRFISPPVPGENTATPNPAGKGGEVIVVNASSLAIERTIILQNSNAEDTPTSASGIPNYLGAASISPDGLSAWVPSKQDNIKRGTLRNGVGLNHDQTLRAIASRINLATQAEDTSARLDFDNAGIPSAAAFDPWGGYLFVALESSRSVAIVDARSEEELMRFSVGRAPQGLALSPDGRTLYVQNFMDRTVTVHDVSGILGGGGQLPATVATVSTVSTEKLTPQLLNGKQLFYDALDSRVALQEYISCAGCHNDGGHDGRTWDLTGFGEGLRNTITLRGHGNQGMLHWSGNFDEVHDFEGQIRNLAGGTGLMSDAQFNTGTRNQPLGDSKAGISTDLDALAAYVKSLTTEPRSPHRSGDGSLTATAVEGEKIFRQQNCASCHSGTGFTNSALNVFSDIGTRKASSGKRLNGALTGFDVPTLRGLWGTAPYLHDGSATTLADAVRAHNGVTLTEADLSKLTAYLQQIDDAPTAAPVPVTVTLASTAPETVNTPFTVSATFSLPVTGFALTDITITGGTVSALTGSGSSFSFTVTPTANVTLSLAANVAQDASNVGNLVSNVISRTFQTTTPPTTPVLVGQDIGELNMAGSTTFDSATGTYTLTASGRDIFFEEDGFHFTKVLLNGDGEIRARVRSFGNTNSWSKAGVMIRENLTAGSRHATTFITPPAAGNGFGMVWRPTANATTNYAQGPALNPVPDNWVRIVRAGNVLTGYVSADGNAWAPVSSATLTGLSSQVFIGLAATSGQMNQSTTAVFDRVQITGTQTVLPPEVTLSAASGLETGPFTVQAQFSQQVTGLALTDFTITNASPSNLTGSGASYSLTLTPTAPGAVTITLPASSVVNAGAIANTASNTLSVTYSPPVVVSLQGQDVGSVEVTGSTVFNAGVYTLKGAGEDIYFNQDGFQFSLTQLNGDGEIRARVTSQTNQNPWAKAGVMFRENLTGGSRHAMMFTTPTGAGNGFGMVWRPTANAATNYAAGPALQAAPNNWVRLVRVGNTLTAYASSNGTSWTTVNTVTLSGLPSSLYVGLGLTSGSRTQLSTATFDNVQIVGAQSAVAPAVTLSSASAIETGSFTVQAQFTQNVTGLAPTDFNVTNGTASNLIGSGTGYSLTITPTNEGNVTITLPAGSAQNSSAIPSTASNTLVVSYLPAVVISLQGQDIGNGLVAGSTSYNTSTGTYTMKGSGEDIFFTADGFHYAASQLVGNGEIRARVTSQTNQNPWGKAGVMFRENLTAGSRYAMTFTTPTGAGNGFGFVWRSGANAAANYAGGPALSAAPNNWVRLVREGDTFTSYASANGTSWTTVSVVRLENMPSTLYVGLALTSSRAAELGTATFDNVQIVGNPPASGSEGSGGSNPSDGTLGSSNAKDRDFDGDDVNDLIEYALNSNDRYDAGWWLTTTPEGRVDAHLVRPRFITNVSFKLESSTDLKTWQPLALAPTVTDLGNNEEQLTWAGLSHLTGQSLQRGIVRLRVTHSSGISAASSPQCWQRQALVPGTQTIGVSWVNAPIYSGFVANASATSVNVEGTILPVENIPCYLEVRDGSQSGHRYDVLSISGQTITLDLNSPHSTLQTLPADIAGARIVIRPHVTLNQVFPKSQLQGAMAYPQADQVLFFKENVWETCWLELSSTRHQWQTVGAAANATSDARIIPPGTGVMVKLASRAVTYTLTGHVRTGAFVRPLDQTHNLLALPWPVDSTPQQLRFAATHGFTVGRNSSVADQLQFWTGDQTPGSSTYEIYWLRQSGTTGAWSPKANASVPDVSATLLIPAHRCFFLKIIPRSGASEWNMPAMIP
ncbi:YVTN family beta-propeller protein [Prosthecobacter fusiformis]|uniref:YVTN family beta-propeller protein n=1 Tax=Prosthecobacter fusiformis TaxID=48464 RepID=A0A4R7S4Q8_9BACT|nr:putative Ig domain-containing protein [Prosthecobacter fusiformis]TDU73324.1 YVTN family beta-propeller protein [Prosthecobacter fusiformis]